MIVVIIAGGSGTRLWPLSTHSYPKHLLSLTNERSLLQNTYERVKGVTSINKIFVIPEATHADFVRKQLPELPKGNFLVEPARRGTASCILLALMEVKQRLPADEPILILWADHLIRDTQAFRTTALKAATVARAQKKLVFIGVEPSYPSTGLGYMERDGALEDWEDVFLLQSFKEKPDKKTARQYYASGKYFWNTGYLTGTLETFEREMKEQAPKLWQAYENYLAAKDKTAAYLKFKSEPIDTALSEKITDGLLVPASFDWIDIGSFKDLHNISLQSDEGNHVSGNKIELELTTNSYVRNETDQPVAVIGVDNVVVINSPNGVLVANKNFSQHVGDVAKRLQA